LLPVELPHHSDQIVIEESNAVGTVIGVLIGKKLIPISSFLQS
jgi:hypothetical protein